MEDGETHRIITVNFEWLGEHVGWEGRDMRCRQVMLDERLCMNVELP